MYIAIQLLNIIIISHRAQIYCERQLECDAREHGVRCTWTGVCRTWTLDLVAIFLRIYINFPFFNYNKYFCVGKNEGMFAAPPGV